MISSAHASSASASTGAGACAMTASQGASTRSRGISRYTGREQRRAEASTRAMSSAGREDSSSTAWSQVISRKMASCESSVRAWWCSERPLARSPRPGAPDSTTTGDFSA